MSGGGGFTLFIDQNYCFLKEDKRVKRLLFAHMRFNIEDLT